MCMGAAFSADGEQLAVVLSNGQVLGYAVDTWQPLFKVDAGPDAIAPVWSLQV